MLQHTIFQRHVSKLITSFTHLSTLLLLIFLYTPFLFKKIISSLLSPLFSFSLSSLSLLPSRHHGAEKHHLSAVPLQGGGVPRGTAVTHHPCRWYLSGTPRALRLTNVASQKGWRVPSLDLSTEKDICGSSRWDTIELLLEKGGFRGWSFNTVLGGPFTRPLPW